MAINASLTVKQNYTKNHSGIRDIWVNMDQKDLIIFKTPNETKKKSWLPILRKACIETTKNLLKYLEYPETKCEIFAGINSLQWSDGVQLHVAELGSIEKLNGRCDLSDRR